MNQEILQKIEEILIGEASTLNFSSQDVLKATKDIDLNIKITKVGKDKCVVYKAEKILESEYSKIFKVLENLVPFQMVKIDSTASYVRTVVSRFNTKNNVRITTKSIGNDVFVMNNLDGEILELSLNDFKVIKQYYLDRINELEKLVIGNKSVEPEKTIIDGQTIELKECKGIGWDGCFYDQNKNLYHKDKSIIKNKYTDDVLESIIYGENLI